MLFKIRHWADLVSPFPGMRNPRQDLSAPAFQVTHLPHMLPKVSQGLHRTRGGGVIVTPPDSGKTVNIHKSHHAGELFQVHVPLQFLKIICLKGRVIEKEGYI